MAAPVFADGDVGIKPITDPKENSPKEELRLKLFKDTATKASCAMVQADPRGGVGSLDGDLDTFLKATLAAIQAKDEKALQPLFHERLNVSLSAIQQTFAKLDSVYGAPFDVSIYRLWALNTVDGNPAGLTCQDDRLTVYPQFGYPLQFALWLQIMGQKELGRIYLSIVPANGKWNIGAFHAQQWTHDSKDFATWAEEGVKASSMGYKEAAFIKFDIAAKLLDGGGFVDVAMRDDVIKTRDAMMPQGEWDRAIRNLLKDQVPKDQEIVHTSTLLVVGGGGILVRLRIPGELTIDQIKNGCGKLAETLKSQPWSPYVEGIRCSYVLPKEDPKTDGAQGGIYVAFADLAKK